VKKISIMTPCYNEEGNVVELVQRIRAVMEGQFSHYEYEHLLIDNASTDNTVKILKELALDDKRIKIIVNSRNFGHIKSPAYGLFQCSGDAVISMVSDLQDPPELISDFIHKWEEGADMVLAIRKSSQENPLMYKIRELYYLLLQKLSEVKIYKNFTGFGLYDQKVIKALKSIDDPYPFLRGMISEVGYSVETILYDQYVRTRGITKNNFYTLYDIGVLGILNYSKVPLRMAIFSSIIIGFASLLTGFGYLIAKLIYWDTMSLGIAPLLIGASFSFAVLLFFIGIIGEYIGMIYTQVLNRPLVFEKERVNFD
jgi:polyisoprenyl-phosphate glycosyltransferase